MFTKSAKKYNTGEVFDMYLGLPGNGKTLVTTEDIVLPLLLKNMEVRCSYWINWNKPNFFYFKDFDEIKGSKNCVCVFDEVGYLMNPREWDSEDASIRNFFMFHRHNYVDIYANTQHISLIAKTALIQVDRFFMLEKRFSHFSFLPWLFFKSYQMTLNEIKLLDVPLITNKNKDDEEIQPYNSISTETSIYLKSRLLHKELNEFKQELIHLYCNSCGHRQYKQIKSEDTENFAKFDKKTNSWVHRDDIRYPLCPKHKEPLSVRESGMFDSNYLPDIMEKNIEFIPFHWVDLRKKVQFKGQLSSKQKELLDSLDIAS